MKFRVNGEMTGMDVWNIVAPILMVHLVEGREVLTPNAELAMECYLTVYRALKQMDEDKQNG